MNNGLYSNIVNGANEINKKSESLLNDALKLQKELEKSQEITNCAHIWFVSRRTHDEHFDDCMFQYTCAKCGQIQFLGNKRPGFVAPGDEYYTDIVCDPELVKDTYKKLVEDHPDLSNFEIAILLESYIKIYNDEKRAEKNGR